MHYIRLTIFSIALLLCGAADAQITLEHAYTDNSYMQAVKLENEGYKYIGYDSALKKVRIYNTDHSLWKEVTLIIPFGYAVAGGNIYATSEYLFNNDAQVEFLISLVQTGVTMPQYQMQLINENGTLLYTFPNGAGGLPIKVAGQWKLQTLNYYYVNSTFRIYTSYYSLPGQYSGQLKAPVTSTIDTDPALYPNPVTSSATLRYILPSGVNAAQVSLYDAAGSLIRSYPAGPGGTLSIERGTLPAGMYLFRITAPGYSSSAQAFTIE